MGTLESTTISRPRPAELIAVREAKFPAAYTEPRWYAAYTCANHEKRVAEQLEGRAIEYFLPLYKSVRHWNDRQVQLDLPLFPGYIFVRLPLRDRLRVLEVPSVVRLVGFNSTPTALPEEEIQALRNGLKAGIRAEPHSYLRVGRRARIISGPLAGREGILLRRKGHIRVVLSIELLQRSAAIEVDVSEIAPA
jgi:transcription antitermination factor NusG